MKSWKLGIAALAMSTALSGGAFAQASSWSGAQQKATVVQSRWQYQDHDRDRDDDRDQDQNQDRDNRKHDHHDNGRWHNDRRDNRDNGWYNNGHNDHDRDDVYRNGRNGYPVGNNGQYGAYGRGRYNSSAGQFGYQDGLRYGQNDAARGKSYNATGSGAYESADRGYNSSFGDKNTYRQDYRQAYEQGYNQGYNGSTYGRRY